MEFICGFRQEADGEQHAKDIIINSEIQIDRSNLECMNTDLTWNESSVILVMLITAVTATIFGLSLNINRI